MKLHNEELCLSALLVWMVNECIHSYNFFICKHQECLGFKESIDCSIIIHHVFIVGKTKDGHRNALPYKNPTSPPGHASCFIIVLISLFLPIVVHMHLHILSSEKRAHLAHFNDCSFNVCHYMKSSRSNNEHIIVQTKFNIWPTTVQF